MNNNFIERIKTEYSELEEIHEISTYKEELTRVPEDSKLFKTHKPTTLCVDKKCTNYSEKSIFYCIICT